MHHAYCHTCTQLDPSWGYLREPMSQQKQATSLHTVSDRKALNYLSHHPEPFYTSGKGQAFPERFLVPSLFNNFREKGGWNMSGYIIQGLSFIKVAKVPISSRSNQDLSLVLLPLPQSQELIQSHSDSVTPTCFYNWKKKFIYDVLGPLKAHKCDFPIIRLLRYGFGMNCKEIIKTGEARWCYKLLISLGFLFIGCSFLIQSILPEYHFLGNKNLLPHHSLLSDGSKANKFTSFEAPLPSSLHPFPHPHHLVP